MKIGITILNRKNIAKYYFFGFSATELIVQSISMMALVCQRESKKMNIPVSDMKNEIIETIKRGNFE